MMYRKDENTLEEIKRDLIDFNNENVKRKQRAYSVIREMFQLPENKTYRKTRLKKIFSEKRKL